MTNRMKAFKEKLFQILIPCCDLVPDLINSFTNNYNCGQVVAQCVKC